jgi:hypothetical protein
MMVKLLIRKGYLSLQVPGFFAIAAAPLEDYKISK